MSHRFARVQLFALILIGMFALMAFGFVQAQGEQVIRIGVLDELYGPISNGARLAVQEINEMGGVQVADGTEYVLELVIAPTGFGQNIEEAVVTLDGENVTAVLGPEANTIVETNLSLLQRLNVPVLVAATGDTVLAQESTGRVFRIRAAEVWQGRALANYLIEELELNQIATIQLDFTSTAGTIGFSSAATAIGVTPSPALLLENEADLPTQAQELTQLNPQAIVAYGPPALAADLLIELRTSGWQGMFAYTGAESEIFQAAVPSEQLEGVIAATTWAYTYRDPASTEFLLEYVRTYDDIPDAISAAAYDGVQLIAAALALPGDPLTNIDQLEDIAVVQGLLQPANLTLTETLTDVVVVEMNRFGVPLVLARYRNNERLPEDVVVVPTVEAEPTPEGVYIVITGERQNVRTGPSIEFPILGELVQGDTATVIGATADNTWVVIDFRGQQGWLATYLLDVFGDLDTVPIITPPATPTPVVTPTPLPPQEPDLIIETVAISPQPIVPNTPFNITVTVRNAGNTAAGPFTVGATLPPTNVATSAAVAGLPPGQTIVVNLPGTITISGFYSASVVVDLNNQVNEGATGELNNVYNINYSIDTPLLSQGSQTLNLGDTIDLEDNAIQGDANWNADGELALDAIFGARLGILPAMDVTQVHFDLVNPTLINRESIPRAELNPGTLVGIITADGNRGVMRVDAVNDQQLTVTYRVYQPR